MITFSTRIGPGFITTPTFEAMRFPAGEAHVKVIHENDGRGPLTEVARLYGADGNDLMTLAMWADAVRQRGARSVAMIPYLPGARQDRGVPFGARVYADLLNSMALHQVIALDAHSTVMPGLVDNLTEIPLAPIVRRHIVGRADQDERPQNYVGIIAPDKGAVGRASDVAKACHLPLYRAEKHRDEATGQLSHFTCEPLPDEGALLVVDDICDGGGTFRGLAAATGLPRERLALWVTHGVFSGRAPELAQYYGAIYSTDSYGPPPAGMNVTTIPIDTYLTGAIR